MGVMRQPRLRPDFKPPYRRFPRWRALNRPCLLLAFIAALFFTTAIFLQPSEPTGAFSQPLLFSYSDSVIYRAVVEALENNDHTGCHQLAMRYPEPYSKAYQKQRIDLNGPVFAYHRWSGKIHKSHIEQQKPTKAHDCRILFKVLDGELHVYRGNRCYREISDDNGSGPKDRYEMARELILLALEIYDVPDVDFVLELDDPRVAERKPDTLPLTSYSISARNLDKAGFTYPSAEAYKNALGSQQMRFYQKCLGIRYPPKERKGQVVWRGKTTGLVMKTDADVYKNRRVSLATLARFMPDTADIGITEYVQVDGSDEEREKSLTLLNELAPLKPTLPLEAYNRYAAAAVVDGNSASQELPTLLISNTPVLKQEYSHWFDYFGHLLTDKEVLFFNKNLTNFRENVDVLLRSYGKRGKWDNYILRSHQFAAQHLGHSGVIRAMAYTMTKQASLMTEKVELERGYAKIPRSVCCKHNPSLPKKLIEKMQAVEENPKSL